MASITFVGPTLTGDTSTTVLNMDDNAFLAVVQAVCATENYNGDNPGLFVLQKTVANWIHVTTHYQTKLAHEAANAQVTEALAPLQQSVAVQIDGQAYDLNTLAPITDS
jgi:hypothetical protein